MESIKIQERLRSAFPSSLLEESFFAKTQERLWVVEPLALPNIAEYLVQESDLRFTQLKHYGMVEQYRRMTGTLSLNSELFGTPIHLRFHSKPFESRKKIDLPSVEKYWVRASLYEEEFSDLFGIHFVGRLSESTFYVSSEDRDFPFRRRQNVGNA